MAGGRAPKAKGSAFEYALVHYLIPSFSGAYRRPMSGNDGRGDIELGIPGWAIEAKNTRRMDISGALAQAIESAKRKRVDNAAAIFKRPGKSDPGLSYVVMTLEQFVRLVKP